MVESCLHNTSAGLELPFGGGRGCRPPSGLSKLFLIALLGSGHYQSLVIRGLNGL